LKISAGSFESLFGRQGVPRVDGHQPGIAGRIALDEEIVRLAVEVE